MTTAAPLTSGLNITDEVDNTAVTWTDVKDNTITTDYFSVNLTNVKVVKEASRTFASVDGVDSFIALKTDLRECVTQIADCVSGSSISFEMRIKSFVENTYFYSSGATNRKAFGGIAFLYRYSKLQVKYLLYMLHLKCLA